MQLDVLFAVDRAGLVPGDGETHQGIYDTAFFSHVGIPLYAPANYAELEHWLEVLVTGRRGPRAIRYPRGQESASLAALGCSGEPYDLIYQAEGSRAVLVSYGAEAEETLAACELLVQQGIKADCCKLVQIYPLPQECIALLQRYDTILFAEDAIGTGGIGEQLGFALLQVGWKGTYLSAAVDNRKLLHANVPELRRAQGLDAAALAKRIVKEQK